MLYLIGLGLNDELDLSLKAIIALQKCQNVYAEFYTNKWNGDLKSIERNVGKTIEVLTRQQVESDFLIKQAKNETIALLVPGDPFTATTHVDLLIEAKKNKIETKIVHASSIFTAIGETGLQLYKFGRTTTLVFPEDKFSPVSPYDVVQENKSLGLHTLVLLDIRQDKQKYMTIKEGLENLLKLESLVKKNTLSNSTKIVACCKLGSTDQLIKYDTVESLIKLNPQKIPAALIIPGKLHFKEEEALELWK